MKTFYFLFSFLLFAFCFLPFTANAQEFSASINPPVIQIEAEAPAGISTPITIENKTNQNITYGIYLRPFKANSNKSGIPNYDPELNEQYEDFFSNVQIREGDKDITEVELNPGQSKKLDLRIQIKADNPPEDRYFTVVFLSEPQNELPQANLSGARGGIGTNVLLSIGPKAEVKGRISNFSTPFFTSKGPVGFTLELTNENNYFVASEGTITITNMFGQIVGALEFGPLNILAISSRMATNSKGYENKLLWNEKNPIGLYKVQAKVALSQRGPLLTEEIIFIAFPFKLVLIFTLGVFIIIWLFRRVRKKANEAD